MDRCRQHLLLLWMIAVVAMNILGNNATVVEEDELQVKNLTNKGLQVIPPGDNNSSVTKLVIEGNQLTLNELDRLALATYPRLLDLYLDSNLVTNITAKYFSVVPHLRVLSLSRNQINSLDPESVSGLDDLTELDLSHNLLTSLPSQLFRGLNHLQVLNLQGNPWNCSCPLLSSIKEIKAAGVTIAGPRTTCASPKRQDGKDLLEVTAKCYPSPPPSSTADPKRPTGITKVNLQQPRVSSTLPKTMLTSSQNRSIIKDQKPVLGNTWKFTACVAALALCISMLIVGAIKGPSFYKLIHNYRHRRLHQDEDDGEDVVSTVFSETEGYLSHQTFTFEQDDGQVEEEDEEEDEYFEDPYIRRDE